MTTSLSTRLRILLVCGTLAAMASTAEAAYRQYYTAWTFYPASKYYYRTLYFKPHAAYTGYNHHYAIYRPDSARYVYFYNPTTKLYWGRYDTQGKPGAEYSLLLNKDRRENLADIPETAFPPPGRMPPLPDSTDGVPIDPPKDLPKVD